ncbi:MAG TPA: divalent-cation tolerance protein CutA [Stenotrophobium sp.]|jgi:periplasmic divalent cation tolerance protein|nr:divalent-cation tolerance protein CutA [Stenotrophobium sp.]
MSTPIYLVLVTCPTDAAESLAEALVEKRLAACVNILPQIRSVYRWSTPQPATSQAAERKATEICKDAESLLLIKTAQNRYEALCAGILALHPYELPEIVAVNPERGHAPYLEWVLAATG